MPKDLRLTIPDPSASSTEGLEVPSGVLFPNFVRADRDYQPQLISGIIKLVQQVAFEILTDRQTDGVGSNLARNLREAGENEIELVARSGVTDLLQRILRYQENLDLPNDERIADLQFLSFTYDETIGRFKLSLRLISVAGDDYTLEAPLE